MREVCSKHLVRSLFVLQWLRLLRVRAQVARRVRAQVRVRVARLVRVRVARRALVLALVRVERRALVLALVARQVQV